MTYSFHCLTPTFYKFDWKTFKGLYLVFTPLFFINYLPKWVFEVGGYFQLGWESHDRLMKSVVSSIFINRGIPKKEGWSRNVGNEPPYQLWQSQLLKSGQFMLYYKRKAFIKWFLRKFGLKTSRLFCVYGKLRKASLGKWNFCKKLIILHI